MSYKSGRILVYLTFNKEVSLREPRAIMGVDINFSNVTYTVIDLEGNLVSMGVIPYQHDSQVRENAKIGNGLY